MIGLLAGAIEARIETRIILTGLLAKAFKVILALPKIVVDVVAICQIES